MSVCLRERWGEGRAGVHSNMWLSEGRALLCVGVCNFLFAFVRMCFHGEYTFKDMGMDGWVDGWMDGWMDGWKFRGSLRALLRLLHSGSAVCV